MTLTMNTLTRTVTTIAILLLSLVALSCGQTDERTAVAMSTISTRELQSLQKQRIYFGHQSVGANIMQGVKEIAAAHPDVPLNVVALKAGPLPQYYITESKIGENGEPASKCTAFQSFLSRSFPAGLDIAVMKFCFVDIRKNSPVEEIFATYRKAVDSIKAAHPSLRLVHVTVPLSVRTSWWKLLIKKVLSKEDLNDMNNIARNRFNILLRETYKNEPIFDLAEVESTRADGSRDSFTHDGTTYYSLVSDYSHDGGHLNATGRIVVADHFLRTLAAVADSTGAGRP